MRTESVQLTSPSPLIEGYLKRNEDPFFSYHPFSDTDLAKRRDSLSKRTFQREALQNVLANAHRSYGHLNASQSNIEKLSDPNTVVVVGGQQIGFFGGPLLSLYKLITIIQRAKELEQSLGVPVVPVFWMA
ncbi:MAG: bacillithiol biosynthesis protein BshC, partial [Bacilli bacterium]